MKQSSKILKEAKFSCKINGFTAITEGTYTFTNTSKKDIETIYTLPMPSHTTLISLEVELDGEVYKGSIKEKNSARRAYEKAIENDDTPVIIEKIDRVRYQIRCGRLRPNDTIVIRLQQAEIIDIIGKSAKYFLPTVIAPTYGNENYDIWDRTENSFFADYPYSMEVSVEGALSEGSVSVLGTNNLTVKSTPSGSFLTFSGKLDKDIQIRFEEIGSLNGKYSINSHIFNGFCEVEQANIEYPRESNPKEITVVADCSGSMMGISIIQLKKSIKAIIDDMGDNDRIKILLFGSRHLWLNSKAVSKGSSQIRKLMSDIDDIDADLGGTELMGALKEAYKKSRKDEEFDKTILLISDVECYLDESDFEDIEELSKKYNSSLFAIGVGDATVVGALHDTARNTGGDTIELSPYEPIPQRVSSLMQRVGKAIPITKNKDSYVSIYAKFDGEYTYHFYNTPSDNGKYLHEEFSLALSKIIQYQKLQSMSSGKITFAVENELLTEDTSLIAIGQRESREDFDSFDFPETTAVEHMSIDRKLATCFMSAASPSDNEVSLFSEIVRSRKIGEFNLEEKVKEVERKKEQRIKDEEKTRKFDFEATATIESAVDDIIGYLIDNNQIDEFIDLYGDNSNYAEETIKEFFGDGYLEELFDTYNISSNMVAFVVRRVLVRLIKITPIN